MSSWKLVEQNPHEFPNYFLSSIWFNFRINSSFEHGEGILLLWNPCLRPICNQVSIDLITITIPCRDSHTKGSFCLACFECKHKFPHVAWTKNYITNAWNNFYIFILLLKDRYHRRISFLIALASWHERIILPHAHGQYSQPWPKPH